MAGLSVIIRKEISDAVSNRTFLLSLAVMLLSMALTGATSEETYLEYLETQEYLGNDTTTCGLKVIDILFPHIKVLGALVAVAYGFNAINKERTEGNLKVLLSYPIYRDQVILGKLVAGAVVISLVTIISITVAIALHFYLNSLFFKPDLVLRIVVFTALSVLFLCGYLGLSMLLSIASKDQKTTLLAMFLIIGLFNSYAFHSFGRTLSDVLYGPEVKISGNVDYSPEYMKAIALQNFIMGLSPEYRYETTTHLLQFHSIFVLVEGNYIRIPSNVSNIIMKSLSSLVLLTIIPIVTFAASYVLFTRRDVT